MNEEFRKTLSEIAGYPLDISLKQILEEDGIKHSDTIALMQCKHLTRTADALEEIAEKLEQISHSMELLSNCVDDTKGYGNRICITGTITNYEG